LAISSFLLFLSFSSSGGFSQRNRQSQAIDASLRITGCVKHCITPSSYSMIPFLDWAQSLIPFIFKRF